MSFETPLEARYQRALASYLAGDHSEDALLAGYDCGRQAMADDRSPLDLVEMHHATLVSTGVERGLDEATLRFVAAGQDILSQSLVSFEVARRGFAEAHAALRRQARRLQVLADASAAFSEAVPDYERLLATVARLTAQSSGNGCTVRLLGDDGRTFHLVAADHPDLACARALRDGSEQVGADMTPEQWAVLVEQRQPLRLATATANVLAVPMVARGRVLGEMSLVRFGDDAPHFDAEDEALLRGLAYGAALALDNARLYREANAALVRERGARTEAEAALRERDEFLSVAAHELKTPLASLRGYAGVAHRMLARGRLDPDRFDETLARIDQQAERLGRLVALVMDNTLLDLGRLHIERTETDVTAAINRIVNTAQARSPRHVLRLQTDDVVADIDPLRLDQVIDNLVDNAIRYSPEGGPIDVRLRSVGEPRACKVRIEVRDYGLGIPPEKREGLFKRFFRAHDDRYASGLGLGLYISRAIVRMLGGQIEAEFPEAGGTRMITELPTRGAGLLQSIPAKGQVDGRRRDS